MSVGINQLTALWLRAHAPVLLDGAALVVALPRRIIKRDGETCREVERWFFNVARDVDAPVVLLVALERPPIGGQPPVIAECFRVPRAVLGTRRVVARYRVKRGDRVGSFLDPYKTAIVADQ